MAIHSSTIAWKSRWTEEPGRLQSMGLQRVGHDFTFTFFQGVSFNFMVAVTACSDLGNQENKICYCFHNSPSICHEVIGPDAMTLVF